MSKRTVAKAEISHEEFANALEAIVAECDVDDLMAIPGIWEILSEHFNNEAIERVEADREENARRT